MRLVVSRSGRSRVVVVVGEVLVDVRLPARARRRLAGLGQLEAAGQRRVAGSRRCSSSDSQLAPGRGVDRVAPAVLEPGPGERREDLVGLAGAVPHPVRARRRTATRCAPARCRRRPAPARRRGRAGGRRGRSRRRRAPGSRRPACAASTTWRTGSPRTTESPAPALPERGVEGAQRRARYAPRARRRPAPTARGRARTAAARRSLSQASSRAGLSARRRSRRNHITAVVGTPPTLPGRPDAPQAA